MKFPNDLSNGSTLNFSLEMDEDSKSLLGEVAWFLIKTQQNVSEGSSDFDLDISSGAWREIEEIVSF